MTSPDPQKASTSSHASSSAVPTQPHRPLHAFWSNSSSSQPLLPTPAPTKRKRRKADDTKSQAKLLGMHDTGWSIGAEEDGANVSETSNTASVKATGRKQGAEEAERKEMAKRMKQQAAAAKKAAKMSGARKKGEAEQGEEVSLADDLVRVPDHTSTIGSESSPNKRKRGRLRKPHEPDPSLPSQAPALPPIPLSELGDHSFTPSEIMATSHRVISDRVSHPFFVRTISTSSKGASHDPIDVEHNARSGPRKLVFASDQKPAHSFFSASDEATVLPEIPFKGKARNVNDFFVGDMTAAEHSAVVKTGWGGGVREGEEWMAPWPGGDWPSHEGAAGPSKALPSLMKKRKSRQVPRSIDSDRTDRWSSFLKHESAPDEPGHPPSRCPQPNSTSNLCDIIDAFKAFRRKKVVGDRETWSERYRPHRAEEILGNKAEAIYLRDWLLALQVGGGRKVVRKVNRSKRQLVEGWIVDDIVLFGDVNDDEGEEDQAEDLEEPESPLGGRPDDYPPLTTRLTNIILLTGPHGSGKSAAVYAAADELGWEVFEVYPGVGKRTGANLMSLVGDVGKNHMVVNGGGKIELEEKGHITSFLKRPKDAEVSSGKASQRSTTVTIEAQQEGHNEFEEREVRQSLILIDEVDILFAEEYTFWPAVVALIADSHRPVILTCNDPQRVPRPQLPLQATLHFRPPSSSLAVPYLEAIANHEGIHEARLAAETYAQSFCRVPEVYDHLLPPNGHEPVPYFDLRRAIIQMQLDRGRIPSSLQNPPVDAAQSLASLQRHLNIASFTDASVAPRSWAVMEVIEIDRHEGCPDDELDILALLKPPLDEDRPTLPAYDRASDIATEMMYLAGESSSMREDHHLARINYIRSLLPVLDPLIPLTSYLLPHHSLFTDYMPVIQRIVDADDAMEAAEEAEVASGGNRVSRKTGRPKRITANLLGSDGYERYLDLGETALEAARASVLQ